MLRPDSDDGCSCFKCRLNYGRCGRGQYLIKKGKLYTLYSHENENKCIWKCISTVSHNKSSRNKERCGINASCMLYSFKIVFPTRQVFSTSALSVVKPTFNVRQNNSIVTSSRYKRVPFSSTFYAFPIPRKCSQVVHKNWKLVKNCQ